MLSRKIALLLLTVNIFFPRHDDTLFFIYNSTDDFPTVISDTFHKALSPNTYPCQLCKLTYNTFSKKKKWKDYLSNLDYNYLFLYKNNQFVIDNKITELPIILFGSATNSKILLSKFDIDKSSNLDHMINMIDIKLKAYRAVD